MTPNLNNSNPFFLTNSDQGMYSFLLDDNRGQLDPGRTYILLVNPPPGSQYGQRRVRIVIGARNGSVITYKATALDGIALTIDAANAPTSTTVAIPMPKPST